MKHTTDVLMKIDGFQFHLRGQLSLRVGAKKGRSSERNISEMVLGIYLCIPYFDGLYHTSTDEVIILLSVLRVY